MRSRNDCWIIYALIAVACVNEHDAVVSTAAIAEDEWTCPEDATQVKEVSYARYRLSGCGRTAVYNCNFSFQPPRCWR
jgi:hypothetical protein